MPVASQPNWELAKQLYIQGLKLRVISEQTGASCSAIAARACRHHWRAIATEANRVVQRTVTQTIQTKGVESGSEELRNASNSARNGLATALEKSVRHLDTLPQQKGLESAYKRASVIKTLADAAKTVHNWGENSQSTLLSITSYTDVEETKPEAGAIDVQGIASPIADQPEASSQRPDPASTPEPEK